MDLTKHKFNPLGRTLRGDTQAKTEGEKLLEDLRTTYEEYPRDKRIPKAVLMAVDSYNRLNALFDQMTGLWAQIKALIDLPAGEERTAEAVGQLQGRCRHDEDGTAMKAYFQLICHLVYTNYHTMQLFDNLLLIPGCTRKGKGEKWSDKEKDEAHMLVKALSNSQSIWHSTLEAPNTFAWVVLALIGRKSLEDPVPTRPPWLRVEDVFPKEKNDLTQDESTAHEESGKVGQTTHPQSHADEQEEDQAEEDSEPGGAASTDAPSQYDLPVRTRDTELPLPEHFDANSHSHDAANDDEDANRAMLDKDEPLREETFDVPEQVMAICRAIGVYEAQFFFTEGFRLGSVTRRQREGETDLECFIRTTDSTDNVVPSFEATVVHNTKMTTYRDRSIPSLVHAYWQDLHNKTPDNHTAKKGTALLAKFVNDVDISKIGLPAGQPPTHCEVTLMQWWQQFTNMPTNLPILGISRACCGTCSMVIREMINELYSGGEREHSILDFVPGTRDKAFWPCMLPTKTSAPIMRSVSDKLEEKIIGLLGKSTIFTQLDNHITQVRRDGAIQVESNKRKGNVSPASNAAKKRTRKQPLEKNY